MIAEALGKLNLDDPDSTESHLEIIRILNEHAEAIKPPRVVRTRGTHVSPPAAPTARKKRRAEYALIQASYRKDRKRCAHTVLNGHWHYDILTANPRVSKEIQEEYWGGRGGGALFGRESPEDQRPVVPVRAIQWDVVRPIT